MCKVSEQNISNITEVPVTEKKYRGCRGPDKKPRNYNPASIENLKQYRIEPELNTTITDYTESVPSLSSNLLKWVVIFVLIVLAGAIIWKIYRDYKEKRSK